MKVAPAQALSRAAARRRLRASLRVKTSCASSRHAKVSLGNFFCNSRRNAPHPYSRKDIRGVRTSRISRLSWQIKHRGNPDSFNISGSKGMTDKRSFIALAAAAVLTTGLTIAGPVLAAGADVNATVTGLALRGYDPVAYFTDNKPVLGDFTITAEHDGATYRFTSEAHKAMFEKDPAQYLPQYGGFCAFGTAQGYKVDGDPNVWRIVDKKLYLNLAPPVAERWVTDIPGYIKSANKNWSDIKDKPPQELLK
jgi:hypothetical protein